MIWEILDLEGFMLGSVFLLMDELRVCEIKVIEFDFSFVFILFEEEKFFNKLVFGECFFCIFVVLDDFLLLR